MAFSISQINHIYDEVVMGRRKLTYQDDHILYNAPKNTYTRTSKTFPGGPKIYFYVHQVALLYKLQITKLSEGHETSHLCLIDSCVNPEHLRSEPHQVNMGRVTCKAERRCRGDPHYCQGNHVDGNGTLYSNCI